MNTYIVGRNVRLFLASMAIRREVLYKKKLKTELEYDPAIQCLRIFPKKKIQVAMLVAM